MIMLFVTALGWNIINTTDTQAFTQIFNDHLNPTPDTAKINNVEPTKSWSLSTLITSYWPGKA